MRFSNKTSNSILSAIFFAFVIFWSTVGHSTPQLITLMTRIVKPDGTALENASVQIRISITDPIGTCVVYQEDFTGLNMAGSKGLTSVSVGTGTRVFPVGPMAISSLFTNFGSPVFNCLTGGTYTAAASDQRKLVMQFNDGSGWQTLPGMSINSTPFAVESYRAQNLGSFPASDYVRTAQFAACTGSEAVHFNGTSFTCIALGAGGGVALGGNTGAITIGTNDASALSLETNNASRLTIDSTGNIGIGTPTPSTNLHVVKTGNGTSAVFESECDGCATSGIDVKNSGTSNGTSAALSFKIGAGATPYASIVGEKTGATSGAIVFSTQQNGSGTLTERMRMDGSGNVDIGTSSQTAKLTVQGAAISKTNIVAAGATVDLSLSNLHYLKAPGGAAITLQNPVDGGTFSIFIADTTARTYTFSGCSNSYYSPANADTSFKSAYTITIIVDGPNTECFINWVTGFN